MVKQLKCWVKGEREGSFKRKDGKYIRIVFIPKTKKATSKFAWTILGTRDNFHETKSLALKTAMEYMKRNDKC